MDIHPIQESSRRWMTALILAVVAAGIQTTLLWGYAGADMLPAAIDGILSVGLLCLLAYLAWYHWPCLYIADRLTDSRFGSAFLAGGRLCRAICAGTEYGTSICSFW